MFTNKNVPEFIKEGVKELHKYYGKRQSSEAQAIYCDLMTDFATVEFIFKKAIIKCLEQARHFPTVGEFRKYYAEVFRYSSVPETAVDAEAPPEANVETEAQRIYFKMMALLVKMKAKYNQICYDENRFDWIDPTIDPPEGFYFHKLNSKHFNGEDIYLIVDTKENRVLTVAEPNFKTKKELDLWNNKAKATMQETFFNKAVPRA